MKAKRIMGLAMAAVMCSMNVLPVLAEEVAEQAAEPKVEITIEVKAAPKAEAPKAEAKEESKAEAPATPEVKAQPAPAPVPEVKAQPAPENKSNSPAPAAKDAPEGSSTTTTTDESTGEKLTVTTDKTTTDNTIKVEKEWTNQPEEGEGSEGEGGIKISGSETTEITETSNGTTTKVTGEEKREWIEEDDGNGEQPEVTVVLDPTKESTEGTSKPVVETEGDEPKGENDKNYNYTETTIIDRTVEASAKEGEIIVEVEGTSNMTGLKQDTSIVDGDMDAEQLLESQTYRDAFWDVADTVAPEGYDYQFTNLGQMSNFFAGTIEPDGSKGATGALQFIVEYDPDHVVDGKDDVRLTKDEIAAGKDLYIAYCCDVNTPGQDNFWYRLDSLEDAGYYDEESAAYIRAIAGNGYWGTSNEKKEDGTYETGSLAKIKEDMKAALAAGQITGITVEEIDAITQGQALSATQCAIWNYANESTDGSKIDPNNLLVTGNDGDIPSEQDKKQAKAVYDYLLSLEPIGKEESIDIIDEDSFIKESSMSITVGNKSKGHAANEDEDEDNDVYDVSVNFALVVTTNENDDLIVQVVSMDSEGNPYIAAQGRIAGDSSNDKNFNEVVFDEKTGSYSLNGLSLSENENFNFDLKLTGTQHLEQGVYIFTSEERTKYNKAPTSQTFVGLIEGDKEVNVSQSYMIKFDVDEDDYFTQVKKWKSHTAPKKSNETPKNPGRINVVLNANFETGEIVPVASETVIVDEEVPLAAVPQTGDNSIIFAIMSIFSMLGIAVLAKKREEA